MKFKHLYASLVSINLCVVRKHYYCTHLNWLGLLSIFSLSGYNGSPKWLIGFKLSFILRLVLTHHRYLDLQGCGSKKQLYIMMMLYNVKNVTKDPNRGYSGTTMDLGTLMLYNIRYVTNTLVHAQINGYQITSDLL
jgi:hypothetical protein